jgi:N-acetyl-anhydromuramyl-L-alanine amidase AmpD
MPLVLIPKPSPNFNKRPAGVEIDAIVLHADSAPSVRGSLSWIRSAKSKVSYHYLIGRHGDVYECVPPEYRAWHAGKSVFMGRPDLNNYSIGVSFGNKQDGEPFTEAQYQRGAELCRELMLRYPAITKERITTHSHVSPGRKLDPDKSRSKWDSAYFFSLL